MKSDRSTHTTFDTTETLSHTAIGSLNKFLSEAESSFFSNVTLAWELEALHTARGGRIEKLANNLRWTGRLDNLDSPIHAMNYSRDLGDLP